MLTCLDGPSLLLHEDSTRASEFNGFRVTRKAGLQGQGTLK